MRMLLALCLAAAAAAPVAAAPPESALTLTVEGLKSPEGQVMVALFDSEAAYKAKATPVRSAQLPARSGSIDIAWTDLTPGKYAAIVYHDRNADGRLNTLPIGLPKEPFGFSNNAPVRFGPPGWTATAFEVAAGANSHSARLR